MADWPDAPGREIEAPAGRLDPRVKIAAATALLALIVSGPGTAWRAAALDLALAAVLFAASRVPVREALRRAAWASPFILAAAALYPLSQSGAAAEGGLLAPGPWLRALTIALKAYASVLVLSLLVLTDRLDRLLGALRSLGFPAALCSIMALAGRFVNVLGGEAARMRRARESRTPGRPRGSRFEAAGQAAAGLVLRARKRARAVQAAMAARGFDGSWPGLEPAALRPRELLAGLALVLPFAAARVFLP